MGRQLGDYGWKPTVRVGEAAMREVAAYLLDHEGFARVPTSVLVRARHPSFCYRNHIGSVRQSSLDLTGGALAYAAAPAAPPAPLMQHSSGALTPNADGDDVDPPTTPTPVACAPIGACQPSTAGSSASSGLPMKLGSLQASPAVPLLVL